MTYYLLCEKHKVICEMDVESQVDEEEYYSREGDVFLDTPESSFKVEHLDCTFEVVSEFDKRLENDMYMPYEG